MIRPIVTFKENDWFIDIKERELRAVHAPSVKVQMDTLDLDELDELSDAVSTLIRDLEEIDDEISSMYEMAWHMSNELPQEPRAKSKKGTSWRTEDIADNRVSKK